MDQNLKGVAYLKLMRKLPDNIRVAKENVATALFRLQVKNLEEKNDAQSKRGGQLNDLRAAATMDIARTVVYCIRE